MAKELSKAVRNEKTKLLATFFNNVAVGVMLGGVFIPYLAIFQHLTVPDDAKGKGLIDITKASLRAIVSGPQFSGLVATAFAAFIGSYAIQRFVASRVLRTSVAWRPAVL